MGFFHKKEKDIPVCGGTDRSIDKNAPKVIKSEKMILFDVTSVIHAPQSEFNGRNRPVEYVSVFAAPCESGSFLYAEIGQPFRMREENRPALAFVKEDVFPSLVSLTRELDLAKENGYHSVTHGLPENFGGSLDVRYESGEKISVSDNQGPVLSYDAGLKIAALFENAMKGEKVELPDVSALKEIRFEEERRNDGFTHAVLTLKPDGSAHLEKRACYDGKKVYSSEKEIDAQKIAGMKEGIVKTALFAWSELPFCGFDFGEDKTLTFLFEDGQKIVVPDKRRTPDQIRSGFFNVELLMTC